MNVIPVTLDEQVRDGINFNNAKGLADMSQVSMAIATQNQVQAQARLNDAANNIAAQSLAAAQQMAQLASQQALNIAASQAQLQQAITGRVARFMLDVSAEESVGFAKEIGTDLSSKLAELGSTLASVQEQTKIAQTTPPQTGTGGAFGSDAGSALSQQLANLTAVVADLQAKITGLKVP